MYSSPALNIQDLPFQMELFVQQVQSSAFGIAKKMLSQKPPLLKQMKRQRGHSLLTVLVASWFLVAQGCFHC